MIKINITALIGGILSGFAGATLTLVVWAAICAGLHHFGNVPFPADGLVYAVLGIIFGIAATVTYLEVDNQ